MYVPRNDCKPPIQLSGPTTRDQEKLNEPFRMGIKTKNATTITNNKMPAYKTVWRIPAFALEKVKIILSSFR
jgi:hypothetical protein